jgi:hypothetical protein
LETPTEPNLPVGAAADGSRGSPTGVPVPPTRPSFLGGGDCRLPASPLLLTASVTDTTATTTEGAVVRSGGGRRSVAERLAGLAGRLTDRDRTLCRLAAARASGAHHRSAHGPGLSRPQRRRASPGHPAPAGGPGPVPPLTTPGQRPPTTSAPWAPPCWPPRPTRRRPSSATAAAKPWPWPIPSGWRTCWGSTASLCSGPRRPPAPGCGVGAVVVRATLRRPVGPAGRPRRLWPLARTPQSGGVVPGVRPGQRTGRAAGRQAPRLPRARPGQRHQHPAVALASHPGAGGSGPAGAWGKQPARGHRHPHPDHTPAGPLWLPLAASGRRCRLAQLTTGW